MKKLLIIAALGCVGCEKHLEHGIISRRVEYVNMNSVYYRFILADSTGHEIGVKDVDLRTYLQYYVGDTL